MKTRPSAIASAMSESATTWHRRERLRQSARAVIGVGFIVAVVWFGLWAILRARDPATVTGAGTPPDMNSVTEIRRMRGK